jgi:hypothetical protein
MSRSLVPRSSKQDEPVIDSFCCTACEWSYTLPAPKPYELSYEQVALACRAFEHHCCQDFRLRKSVA